MTSQAITFSFEDLAGLTADNLNETILPTKAVQVTIDACKAGDVLNCEIYKSWTTSLFQQYGPTAIRGSDLNKLLDLFSSAIKELLNECQERISETQNDKLTTFLNYSMELFTWIRSAAKDFDTNEITAFLCFGLSVINNYLVVLSKRTDQVFVNKVLEKLLALQALVLGILSENPRKFYFANNGECVFSNLISHLCTVGELTPKLDIKTAVDTWKCITRLASQNIIHTQSDNSENSPSNDIIWLKKPMSFLITEVGRNTQTVYKENSLNEPIQQIEKYLKVTNFYLKLLQKLTMDSRHLTFPVCEDFLNTFAIVFTPPAYIVNTPVHKAVMEYVTRGFRELIPFAYRNKLFFELLLRESGDIKTKEAFYEITLEVIELIIQKNEAECLNPQLLDAAFQKSSKSTKLFVSTSTYSRIIETLSALHVHFHLEQFEKTLVDGVLQEDIVLAFTAIDLWCTIFSISNHSTRLLYFKFWRDINESFAKCSSQFPALYVEILLKNLYAFLTNQEKDEIWTKFNARTLTNDRFLLAIGLDAIPNNSAKQTIIQHFGDELTRFLKESSNDMAVDNFYTIVRDLKLLTPVAFQNEEVIEMLLQYLKIAMKNNKFILLIESILDFISPKLESIDDGKILKILTDMSMELTAFGSDSTKLCLVGFLKRTSKNHRLEKHSDEILKVIESDELIRYLGNIEETTSESVNPMKNEKLFQEVLSSRSMRKIDRIHICSVEEEMHVKKKMRIDTNLLLKSLENNVDKLQSNVQLEQLTSSNIEVIKRVVSKLQGIGAHSLYNF